MIILQFHMLYVVLLHGMARDIRSGWHHSLWPSRTILHMLFWIMVGSRNSHREGSRSMHCTTVFRQKLALVISPLCMPTLRLELLWKAVLSIFRQLLHVLPELMCLRRATCLSNSLFTRCTIWVLALELESKWRQNYMSSFWLVLFSGRLLYNGTYCVGIWRVLRTSQSGVSGRLAGRNM